MEELVDILVTTYNTNEKYLKKQIESILKQTYRNIKIYISDDNSPNPRVAEILKQYKEDRNLEFQYTFSKNNNMQFIIKENEMFINVKECN